MNTNQIITHEDYTWAQDGALRPYLASTVTTQDGTVQKKSTQVLDSYGNVTQTQLYDWGNLGTPARTYTNTYLSNSNYTSRYILNRLSTSTVQNAGPTQTITLVSNSYDTTALVNRTGLSAHDDTNYPVTFNTRGNVTVTSVPGSVVNRTYDIAGFMTGANDGNGHSVAVTPDAATNTAPGVITPNNAANRATSATYNQFLGVTGTTAPNQVTTSNTYDSAGRVATSTSATNAQTVYTYNDASSPPTQVATTNGHWVKSTLDGLGRAIKAESGYGTTTVSVVDTVYNACGCSPLGKMNKVSQPYTPGGTPVYTTYNYDGVGRTLSVVAPDGSATTYSYAGNQVTAMDAAGKRKTHTTDALGNLIKVTEPDPFEGGVDTNYTYDLLNHLTQVSMRRKTPNGLSYVTQTRTFTYDAATQRLTSAQNPESGTVSYNYNADGTLNYKLDAKGQKVAYQYDGFQRATQINRYPAGAGVPDVCQSIALQYDFPALRDDGFTQVIPNNGNTNALIGRLAGAAWGDVSACGFGRLYEAYAYTQPGQVAQKRLLVEKPGNPKPAGALNVGYTYNNEGKMVDENVFTSQANTS